jgi:hypothetical protein
MSHLTLEGDNVTYNPIGLAGDGSVAITLDDTGTLGFAVEFLGLTGTTSVGVGNVAGAGGSTELRQLADFDNTLTTVTISGSDTFALGKVTGASNSGDGLVTDIAAKAASLTRDPFVPDAHRCVGDDRPCANLCRCHKHEQRW